MPQDIERAAGALEQEVTAADLPRLDTLLATGRPVWLILSHADYVDPDGLVTRYLDERRSVTDRQQLYRIEIRRYAP
jgi:hypothetical protein